MTPSRLISLVPSGGYGGVYSCVSTIRWAVGSGSLPVKCLGRLGVWEGEGL